ncbi:ABC transporter substrate-binding protein [Butyrivibrio sp. MC2013]|uniref:ABC transporter substrate-binding protein n=1 Tax=Butyrivibrio sp. MC2013 TaxID=1280686 RepID=UPI0004047A95|nr:ABC transporter substrate-binding protein [Butyrivibrio sp. MC2013]
MKKKILSVLLAAAMVSGTIAGCGNSGSTGTTGTDSGSGAEETTTDSGSTETADSTSDEGEKEEAKPAASGQMTEVGTPREETLIVETQTPTDVPGQFNTYMQGTQAGFGIHQLMSAMLWEMDTVKGEQYGEVADGMPEQNEDYTEHTVHIRQGINWSDGEPLTAKDVAFTFNMIMNNDAIGASTYYNSVFESVEATDDYTVVLKTKEPFPRLAQKFGVTIWGNDMRVVPEHIYSQVEDVSTFKDENPVVAGPYTVKSYDPLGKWILYERREDWDHSTTGVVTGKEPAAKYVWFRYLGDDTTRQMAMVNNEVDILCEVTPEILTSMIAQNPNIAAWYDQFPYATSDDPCSKGLAFSMGKGAPYDNKDFRWGIALAMNFDEISTNIFDGIGRASAWPILTGTSAMMDLYYKPMEDWLESFELDLGDGTTVKPWDPDYAERMGENLRNQGYDIPTDHDQLIDMFGTGCWRYDPEAATKLLQKAGLELKDGKWYFGGEEFVCNLTYIADTEAQAGRGTQAAYDQLKKFGLNVTIASESSATWDANGSTGNYDIAGYWPTGGITRDLYTVIQGYDADLIVPTGENAKGQGCRWNNKEATDIIHKLAQISPDSDESYELCTEFMKIAIEDLPFIGFHSGIKFVPTNSTYWTNYPSSQNPYNGPWWWWSCFKYIVNELQPVA